MYDVSYRPLTEPQYLGAVDEGTLAGLTSPIRDDADYTALEQQSQRWNIDPRIALAWTWSEGHMGSDPGLVAAKVKNLGGIKWAGQPGAFDSGIPADTGGTYAGFTDTSVYWNQLYATLNNSFIGAAFRAGDLIKAAEIYTNGPGTGHNKVDFYERLLTEFPATGTIVQSGIFGEDLIGYLRTLIGQASSTAETDPVNGVHPWAFWCESLAERVPEHFGLMMVHRGSAYLKGLACQQQGLFRPDNRPRHGDWMIFDLRFYAGDGPQNGGHIGFWDEDKQQVLGTVTDGTGIGYRSWGPDTFGFMGCAPVPGTVDARRVTPVPSPAQDTFVLGGNPWGAIPIGGKLWARWDELNRNGLILDHAGAINPLGLALPMIGFPRELAVAQADGTVKQRFERGTLMTTTDAAPWDVVMAFPQ